MILKLINDKLKYILLKQEQNIKLQIIIFYLYYIKNIFSKFWFLLLLNKFWNMIPKLLKSIWLTFEFIFIQNPLNIPKITRLPWS